MHIPCCSRSAVSSSCESWIICSLGISFGSAVYTEDSKQAICKNASYNLWPSFIRALSKYCITFCRSPSSSCVWGKAAANASSAEKTIKNLIGIWNEMILSVSFVLQAVLSQIQNFLLLDQLSQSHTICVDSLRLPAVLFIYPIYCIVNLQLPTTAACHHDRKF